MNTHAQKKTIRIGNASGYWGDDPHALYRQVTGGPVDYVTMDFLAEVTMSIMQKQRSRNPELGYARDFITMMEETLPEIVKRRVKLITNAGGVNPVACAAALEKLAAKLGITVKVAVVYGDDILADLPLFQKQGVSFDNMETGEAFRDISGKVESANVYFGAVPVAHALKFDPDVVLTGRVTDTGLTLGPLIHEFGWALKDYDKLASGIIAGHIIECGSQSSGGNFTDWHLVPSFVPMGYPICEVQSDGSFVVTKHEGTGGLVSVDTVREQLVYEMGNPNAYITPDVTADFTSIRLESAGANRVRVSGVRGFEATNSYKVSMAYSDGFKVTGSIVVCGPEARKKSEALAKIFWQRAGGAFECKETEHLGWNACHRSLGESADGNEILLRLGARSKDEGSLKSLAKLIPSLILSGPPGVAVLGGVSKPQEVVTYWPALMPKDVIKPHVGLFAEGRVQGLETISGALSGDFAGPRMVAGDVADSVQEEISDIQRRGKVPLSVIALGRSGDKGDTANIGILARSKEAYAFLVSMLTAQVVKDLFQEICHGSVYRYEVENISALNFLLEKSLGGGGTKTLRVDAQGKMFAQGLLRQKFDIPDDVLKSIKSGGA